MPCCEVFDRQSAEYNEQILQNAVRARVAIEAGTTTTWYKYVGLDGKVLGLDHYGASAPADLLFKRYGFTVENAVAVGKAALA